MTRRQASNRWASTDSTASDTKRGRPCAGMPTSTTGAGWTGTAAQILSGGHRGAPPTKGELPVAIRSVATIPASAGLRRSCPASRRLAPDGRSAARRPPPSRDGDAVVFGLQLQGPCSHVEMLDDALPPRFPEASPERVVGQQPAERA